MSRIIDRETCRRLYLPTVLAGVTAIGSLYMVHRHKNYMSVILWARGDSLELKFSDEDAASDEGYIIDLTGGDYRSDVVEVRCCRGTNCYRGCGCGCIHDFGYTDGRPLAITPDDSRPVCRERHSENLSLFPSDERLFRLKTCKKMVNELVSAYLESTISAGIQSQMSQDATD